MKISRKKFKTHLQFYMKISIKKCSSFFTWKSLVNCFQKSYPKNWTHLQFYKRSPYKIIIFNFTKEIPKKILHFFRGNLLYIFSKDHHQKIELTFNFTIEIPIKKLFSILQMKFLYNLFVFQQRGEFYKRNPCEIFSEN